MSFTFISITLFYIALHFIDFLNKKSEQTITAFYFYFIYLLFLSKLEQKKNRKKKKQVPGFKKCFLKAFQILLWSLFVFYFHIRVRRVPPSLDMKVNWFQQSFHFSPPSSGCVAPNQSCMSALGSWFVPLSFHQSSLRISFSPLSLRFLSDIALWRSSHYVRVSSFNAKLTLC